MDFKNFNLEDNSFPKQVSQPLLLTTTKVNDSIFSINTITESACPHILCIEQSFFYLQIYLQGAIMTSSSDGKVGALHTDNEASAPIVKEPNSSVNQVRDSTEAVKNVRLHLGKLRTHFLTSLIGHS